MPTVLRERPTHSRRPTGSCACAPHSRARDGRFAHPNAYGEALWYGIFDAAYTRPGDYLVQADGVWFIAAQQRAAAGAVRADQPHRLVLAPGRAVNTGVNNYGGVTAETNRATARRTGRPASWRDPGAAVPVPICQATARCLTGRFCLPAIPGRDPAAVRPDDATISGEMQWLPRPN